MNSSEWDKMGKNIKTNSIYDEDGYDIFGWNAEEINKETHSKYDKDGFDMLGYNREGYDREGYDEDGYDRGGYDEDGYDRGGYDKYGYNREGYNWHGYDREGYNRKGYNWHGYDREGYDRKGYDREEYDRRGFDRKGINKETKDFYDREGYNKDGFDREGYDREGYDCRGFDRKRINKGTKDFYDREGYDKDGYNRAGYDKDGYNREGYDRRGFDRRRINRETHERFDREGYDKDGYNREGYNCLGHDREGYDKFGKHYQEKQKIYNKEKNRKTYLGLLNKAKKLAKGELSIQEYVKRSKMSIDELILFANKNEMGADVIRGLYRQKELYKMYTKPFSKKKYLDSTTILVNGEPVKPTEQDVDQCIEFLKSKKEIICEKTVRDTVRAYLRGEIDITVKENISEEVNQSHDEELTELDLVAAEQKNLQGILQDIQQKSKLVQNQISDIENSQLSEKDSGRKM